MLDLTNSATCSEESREMRRADIELACAALKGDPEAQNEIVMRCYVPVCIELRAFLFKEYLHELEDLAQEVCISLCTALESFRGRCSLESFARGIARRTALNHCRRARRRAILLSEKGEAVLRMHHVETLDPERQLQLAQRKNTVRRQVFSRCAPQERLLFALIVDRNLNDRECAREMGISRANVASLKYRIKRKIEGSL